MPDNCLFADQAGDVFKDLTSQCDLHTVLRLPNGAFSPYSPDTKTNVIFFRKDVPTEHVWIYDGRTNVPRVTKKDRPLTPQHLAEFERCFGDDPNGRAERDAATTTTPSMKSSAIQRMAPPPHPEQLVGGGGCRRSGGGAVPTPWTLPPLYHAYKRMRYPPVQRRAGPVDHIGRR